MASLVMAGWAALSAAEADSPQPGWWLKPHRLIQTNLREIDANIDLDAYVAALKDFRANVVLFNVGGIVANYPTDLPFHFRNPHMQGDFTGEVVRRLHAEGIRIIGRFDFSKVNVAIAQQHPEWLSRTAGGPFPAYNGQVPTCLNGGYQQDSLFQILGEALARHPLDGVFFNMIGYPRRDYSGRYLGLCQCDACRARFRQLHQLELPAREDANDPVFRQYEAFCRATVSDQFERVNRFIKARGAQVAICTYTPSGVDVIRSESNTPHGQWTYEDSEKARRTLRQNPDQMLANAAVHFIHYPQRHAAVSPYLTQRRLLQHLVNGAWLDFYCIGPLHRLEDRLGLDEVRNLYRFHATHERWLGNTEPVADVGLMMDTTGRGAEYRGLFKILSEAHAAFDLAAFSQKDWSQYPALIVPCERALNSTQAHRLDAYVAQGGRLLLTGGGGEMVKATGLRRVREVLPQTQGTYIRLRPEDQQRLGVPVLEKLDLVFLDGDLTVYETDSDVEGLLRYIPPAMFGPPEKCYYTNVSDLPALLFRRHGAGTVAVFPWSIGAHYEQQGHPGHAALVWGALERLLALPRRVRVDAPPLVEINHRAGRAGRFEWVSLINHSGLLEKVLHAPVPVREVGVKIKPRFPVKSVRQLKAGRALDFTLQPDGWIECQVPELASYEVVLFSAED